MVDLETLVLVMAHRITEAWVACSVRIQDTRGKIRVTEIHILLRTNTISIGHLCHIRRIRPPLMLLSMEDINHPRTRTSNHIHTNSHTNRHHISNSLTSLSSSSSHHRHRWHHPCNHRHQRNHQGIPVVHHHLVSYSRG